MEHHREALYGAAVYGSVLAAALLGTMVHGHDRASTMTLRLLGSMLVFWLAHLWAELVGERAATGRRFERARVLDLARAEWPLVEAALAPGLVLAGAWAGLYSPETGVRAALVVALLQLVGWGTFAAHRSEPSWWRATALGAVEGLLGVGIVALELALH